jgi:hypothetical protein
MKQSSWIKRSIAVACCACGMATASAQTVTLNFNQIGNTNLYPLSYTESGFIVTPLYPGGHLNSGGTELWLHNSAGSSPYRIQRLDGGTFDVLAFDYFGGDSSFVSNTGASFDILGPQPRATFSMPASFQHVTYIDWYMPNSPDSDGEIQWGVLDNVVMNVSPVPEPASVAMLGFGLGGMLLYRRRGQGNR